jgi:hypothetical protein
MEQVLLEKLTGSHLVKKFPTFYVTRKFITAFTRARHLSLSRASSIQPIHPHPTSWRSILVLSSHVRLGLHVFLRFPQQTLYTPLLSPIRATCPALPILLDLITRTWRGHITENTFLIKYTSFLCVSAYHVKVSQTSIASMATTVWLTYLLVLSLQAHYIKLICVLGVKGSNLDRITVCLTESFLAIIQF